MREHVDERHPLVDACDRLRCVGGRERHLRPDLTRKRHVVSDKQSDGGEDNAVMRAKARMADERRVTTLPAGRAKSAWQAWLRALADDAEAALAAALTYEALGPADRDAWLDALDEDAPEVLAPRESLYAPLLLVEDDAGAPHAHRDGLRRRAASRNAARVLGKARGRAARVRRRRAALASLRRDASLRLHGRTSSSSRSTIRSARATTWSTPSIVARSSSAPPLADVVEELAHAILAARARRGEIPAALASFAHLFTPEREAVCAVSDPAIDLAGRCGSCARFVRVIERIDENGEVTRSGDCLLGVWPSPLYETNTCVEYIKRGLFSCRSGASPSYDRRAFRVRRTPREAGFAHPEPPSPESRFRRILLDMDADEFKRVLRTVIQEELGTGEVDLGGRWQGGESDPEARQGRDAEKRVPLEAFFHKIVMVRDKLRVLEQKINAHPKLDDEEKVQMQQYVTQCYGSLTTFNVLFANQDDGFVGQKK